MNEQSPPKRLTRARAAAKTDTAIKTTKIATASSKAKVTRATSIKRKTRADEAHEEEEQHQQPEEEQAPQEVIEPEPQPKTTRGRAKKTAEPELEPEMEEAPAPVKATRGRPKKAITDQPPVEPARSLRGRPKKIDVPAEPVVAEEPVKRTTRGRAATVTKPPIPKKTVKFEEPDKENIVPASASANTASKAKPAATATGLRAKPVRKPAAARATRGRKVEEKAAETSPLSPKKITQMGTSKEIVSEDELATDEKTPMKALMKSPVKPPGSIFGASKKLDFSTSITVHHTTLPSTENLKASIMASPARRPPQSPFKDSLKTSPAKPGFGASLLQQSPLKPAFTASIATATELPFKTSLLQLPARHPQSPTKVSEAGSPTRVGSAHVSIFDATPKASTFKISRFMTPRTLPKSVTRPGTILPPAVHEVVSAESPLASKDNTDVTITPPTADDTDTPERLNPALKFSGRLSSIMSRETDPDTDALTKLEMANEEATAEVVPLPEQSDDMPMAVDEVDTIIVQDVVEPQHTIPPASPLANDFGSYALREENNSPFDDSDSEDELASGSPMYSPVPLHGFSIASPTFAQMTNPFASVGTPTLGSARSNRQEQRQRMGFTPLAKQLGEWMGASPSRSDGDASSSTESSPGSAESGLDTCPEAIPNAEPSPAKSSFFDDEMTIRDELALAPEQALIEPEFLEVGFTPVELDEEDLDLAVEADEMSMLEPDQIQEVADEDMFSSEPLEQDDLQAITTEEPAPSEASQEYGDENAIPIDPALQHILTPEAPAAQFFSTPKRVLAERVCHTVSKVPLKPAADDTPMRASPLKRSASISRIPVQRPALSRNNTVISYSPSKSTARSQVKPVTQDVEMEDVATPSKPEDIQSTIATPARTPRRDIDTALLKGAVVFVDVHTTEGADASVLFTELLTQMGARCIKSWSWNGNGEESNKIGITHVVYKDGGKRTLEKVKQAGGVVACVGVSWVLDCERQNKWLDEAPYMVDSGVIPRGGSRRRKSMEPQALANLNGTLISSATPSRTPAKNQSTIAATPLTSKSHRRDSVQWEWVRTPPSASSVDNNHDEQTLLLSPVPATPAPETISAYGEDGLYGETPGGQTPYFLRREELVQKTAPVKRYVEYEQADETDAGAGAFRKGFLTEKKDESVMMRLMAVRRKSLQWAPKVGSPLARGIV